MKSVTERIYEFNQQRLASVVPLKYQALRENAFRFFRGTAHLFYEDLAKESSLTTGPAAWICGDLHLENFGTYKGDNRLIYFDINDFDECVLAPVTLEVIRILTSIFVSCNDLNLESGRAPEIARQFLDEYITTVLAGKAHSFQRETTTGLIRDLIDEVGKRKDKELLDKRTESHKGILQLSIIAGKTTPVPEGISSEIAKAFASWNEHRKSGYKLIDIASRIMGTGSLGLERYILLCLDTTSDKPILLDLKEAAPSSVLNYFKLKQPRWDNDAQRVTRIQTLLQDTPPALLHEVTMRSKSYVIKELQPSQDKLDLAVVAHKNHKFGTILSAMANISASAHLRATGRYSAATGDSLIEFVSTLNPKLLLERALEYSKQVDHDFKEFAKSTAP